MVVGDGDSPTVIKGHMSLSVTRVLSLVSDGAQKSLGPAECLPLGAGLPVLRGSTPGRGIRSNAYLQSSDLEVLSS